MAARKKNRKCDIKGYCPGYGFSANTVSRALADKPDISEETKAVIREEASRMGYIANALASFLRSGVSRNIAILVGDISNPHFSVMVKEMQTLLQRRGYNSIIFNTEEKAAFGEAGDYDLAEPERGRDHSLPGSGRGGEYPFPADAWEALL